MDLLRARVAQGAHLGSRGGSANDGILDQDDPPSRGEQVRDRCRVGALERGESTPVHVEAGDALDLAFVEYVAWDVELVE